MLVTNAAHQILEYEDSWVQHSWQVEVFGYHHDVFNGFLSLHLALFNAGKGEVRARFCPSRAGG